MVNMPDKKQNEIFTNEHCSIPKASLEETMGKFYHRQDLQKIAFTVYQKYGVGVSTLSWEDVFSEALLRLVLSIKTKRFKGKAKITSYFWSICFNYCKEMKRKERGKEMIEADLFVDPISGFIQEEEKALLLEVLARQTAKCQRIFELLFFEDNPPKMSEIADEINLNGGRSVSTTFGRCKKQLIKAIKKVRELNDLVSRILKS